MPGALIDRRRLAGAGLALLLAAVPTPARSEAPARPEGTLSDVVWSILNVLGITTAPVGMLGEGGAAKGEIWIAASDGSERHRLTDRAEYAWPVFTADGKAVLALRGASLVRIEPGSAAPVTLAEDTSLTKLLGARPDGSVVGIVPEGPFGRLATGAPDGSVTLLPVPATREEKRLMAALLGESRAYRDDRKLLVDWADYEDRMRRGFDVYIETAKGRVNLSRCETAACGQPSLSLQGDRVAYIRNPQS
jgi:hypothetical protein